MRVVVLRLCTAMVLVVRAADAQMPLPVAKPRGPAPHNQDRRWGSSYPDARFSRTLNIFNVISIPLPQDAIRLLPNTCF